MSTLRVLAMLAIAVGRGAAVLAEQPSSAQRPELGGVVGATFTEPAPQTGPAHAASESCPYHFGSDMPAATFCVYRGVAFGGGGEVCATDVVAIWSSSQAAVGVERAEPASGSTREVYLAFVADPELVVRAIVDSRRGDRAEMVGYTLGSEEAARPLAGRMTRQAVRQGSSGTADVLSMELRDAPRFGAGSCAFASYAGTFLGVMRPPSETTVSAETFSVPRQ